jgi:hypothetical protein
MPVAPLKELVLAGATGGLAAGGRRGRLGAVVALVAMWPWRRASGPIARRAGGSSPPPPPPCLEPLPLVSGALGARKEGR